VSSVIQIDELLQRTLPARAKLKLRKLLAAAEDAQSAHMAAIQRAARLREEQGLLAAEQRQAEERARPITDKPEAVEAAAAQYTDAIGQLQIELERLTPQLQQREQRRNDSARLIGALRGFLGDAASRNQPLAPYQHPPPQLRADEDPVAGIRRLRGEIDALERELSALQRASLPTGELQQRIRDYVAELARGGMPSLFTDGGQFRVDWPAGSQTPAGTLGPGCACVIAALFPDALISTLDAQAARLRGTGLSSPERAKKVDQIKDRLLTLQRSEESLIERFEDDLDLPRRPGADPLAVLSIRYDLAAARAS
jgi:hypothetical protein